MADRALFIGFGIPVRGREERAVEVFNEFVGMFGRMQSDGRIESMEVTLLDPHGGDLGGFFMVHGSEQQCGALQYDEEFRRGVNDATLIVENFGIVPATVGEAIGREMAMYVRGRPEGRPRRARARRRPQRRLNADPSGAPLSAPRIGIILPLWLGDFREECHGIDADTAALRGSGRRGTGGGVHGRWGASGHGDRAASRCPGFGARRDFRGPLGDPAHLRRTSRTPSCSRATMPRATGCGRSTCGAAAGSAGCRRRSAAPTSSRIAPPGCPLPRGPRARVRRLRRGPEQIATAFAAGVNAYIDEIERGRAVAGRVRCARLPAREWAPEDVVRIRSHGPVSNLADQVTRALVLRDFGREAEAMRKKLEPKWRYEIPEGLDLDDIPDDVLDVYDLAIAPVEFAEAKTSRRDGRGPTGLEQLGDRRAGDRERPPHPRQRPAPRPGRAVAALPRPPHRARPQRDRRRGARAPRHLDRPQRARSPSA